MVRIGTFQLRASMSATVLNVVRDGPERINAISKIRSGYRRLSINTAIDWYSEFF